MLFYGGVSPPEPDGGVDPNLGDAWLLVYDGSDVMQPDVSEPEASTDATTDAREGSTDVSDAGGG